MEEVEKKGGEEGDEDEDEDLKWEEMTVFQKIIFCVQFPFLWLRKLTMPPCEKEDYDKNLCILWPVFGLPFIIYAFSIYKYMKFEYLLIGNECLTAIIIIALYYTQKDLKEG